MKQSRRCPKCQGRKIGTYPAAMSRSVYDHDKDYDEPDNRRFELRIRYYVCIDCGYQEGYLERYGEIPFDELHSDYWQWVNPPQAGPFR